MIRDKKKKKKEVGLGKVPAVLGILRDGKLKVTNLPYRDSNQYLSDLVSLPPILYTLVSKPK